MEIVGEPDLADADEAIAYLTALKEILVYAGVSDCNLEEGNMRSDVNISIRPVGSPTLGTKVEIKNMNSFSGIHAALVYEARRQRACVAQGVPIVQETRRWDPEALETASMRTKENAHDYRYFPEPDLVPVALSDEQIEQLRRLVDEESLPVLCFGLRTDFLTHLFPGSRRLFELADSITEIKTICDCGRKATTNARISPDGYVITEGDQVFLGGNDSYIAMCHKCYQDYINEHRKVELLHGTERDPQ